MTSFHLYLICVQAVRRNLDLFLREHKSAKQGHLPENLQRIEDNFQELEDLVRERREKGEDEQNEVAVFQEKMNDMYDWIHSKEQELGEHAHTTQCVVQTWQFSRKLSF